MGFPMTWSRLVHRNRPEGGYRHANSDGSADAHASIAGDMRRLEQDSLSDYICGQIAEKTGVPVDSVRVVAKELLSCFAHPQGHGDSWPQT